MSNISYHPDPGINAEVAEETLIAEIADLKVGYPPRGWTCECGRSHLRGHFMTVGVHRCMGCGYVGTGGVMWDQNEPPDFVDLPVSRPTPPTGASAK